MPKIKFDFFRLHSFCLIASHIFLFFSGIYPTSANEVYAEDYTVQDRDFVTKLCIDWENVAKLPSDHTTRQVIVRTGEWSPGWVDEVGRGDIWYMLYTCNYWLSIDWENAAKLPSDHATLKVIFRTGGSSTLKHPHFGTYCLQMRWKESPSTCFGIKCYMLLLKCEK